MKYLKDIKTLEQLKKEFRKWAMQLHPDRGGTNEEMRILNAEYEAIFSKVKDIHTNKDGEEYHKESEEKPTDFINIINELLKLNNIKIEVIGCFVWVSGDTKPYKEILKGLGFRWHHKKKCWYHSPEGYRRFGKKEYSMQEIRSMYGVDFEEETRHKEIRTASGQ